MSDPIKEKAPGWQARGESQGNDMVNTCHESPEMSNTDRDLLRRLISIESGGGPPTIEGAKKFAKKWTLAQTCYHEAGHSVAYYQMGCPIERVVVFKKGGGFVTPDPTKLEHILGDNYRFGYASGIAAQMRYEGVPAASHPNLSGYLKREHKPGFLPPCELHGKKTLSDLLGLLNYHFPKRKYFHMSERKKRKFYALAAEDVRDADHRLAPDWLLVQTIAGVLLDVPCLEADFLKRVFRWWELVGKKEVGK